MLCALCLAAHRFAWARVPSLVNHPPPAPPLQGSQGSTGDSFSSPGCRDFVEETWSSRGMPFSSQSAHFSCRLILPRASFFTISIISICCAQKYSLMRLRLWERMKQVGPDLSAMWTWSACSVNVRWVKPSVGKWIKEKLDSNSSTRSGMTGWENSC